MDEKSSNHYCHDLVRQRDYNRYLLGFFVPRALRPDMMAILALNVELQSIPDKTKEPVAALIRVQWWRDEIAKIYNGTAVQSSPILPPLQHAIDTHNIKTDAFESLLTCYDTIIRGTPTDPDDALYHLLSSIMTDDNTRHAFSKKLQLHDRLNDNTPFRALRLWVGF